MRRFAIVAAAAAGVVLLGSAGAAVLAWRASGDFAVQAKALDAVWNRYQNQGVQADALNPLRSELAGSGLQGNFWSLAWFNGDGGRLLHKLQSQTAAVWMAAMNAARQDAQAQIDAWQQLQLADSTYLQPATVADATRWPQRLQQSSNPMEMEQLAGEWQSAVTKARNQVQTAKDEAAIARTGGTSALIDLALHTAALAVGDNLDDLGLYGAAVKLQQAYGAGADTLTAAHAVLNSLASVKQELQLNDELIGLVRNALWDADQAAAEVTPQGAQFVARVQALQQDFKTARSYGQLNSVRGEVLALDQAVNAELQTNVCGHSVGTGKVITINLALQEMIFYDSGCVVKATPVTTGRPGLRTPAGHYSVFYKTSPFTMVSPWPPGSEYWYPTTQVTWVMEFITGGYFIHDASWESSGAFGPGSEDNLYAASHGCVHVPTDTMKWAYSWTPIGTPVLVT